MGKSEVDGMEESKRRTTGQDVEEGDSTRFSDRGWDRLQSAVDEAEVQSFPASDPQSSWAGPDRDGLPRWGSEQNRRAS